MTVSTAPDTDRLRKLADDVVVFLETGTPPPNMFAPGVFLDFTMPTWRLQASGVEDSLALRSGGHPGPGQVLRSRFDRMPSGFVLEVEEAWDEGGEHWYCRELFRADVGPAGITDLAVYCTGDWTAARVAQHARSVTVIRP
jgi:hypothetical protein